VELYDLDTRVVAVSDIKLGSVTNTAGLDLPFLVQQAKEKGSIRDVQTEEREISSMDVIRQSGADVVAEMTWSNLVDGQPGLNHVWTALEEGCHVVTSNKGPITLKLRELQELADRQDVQLGFEATVLSGTPIIRLGREALLAADIRRIEGILNGTTNYILSKMEEGVDYDDALKEAQRLGFAEADPSADVEAWDPTAKTVILANALMEARLEIGDVERRGIAELSREDLEGATRRGGRLRLVSRAERTRDGVRASCVPEEIPSTSLLANLNGATNAVVLATDVQRDVSLVGPGAGPESAAYGILSDIVAIRRSEVRG
jgi:homoserine dehydrogenase